MSQSPGKTPATKKAAPPKAAEAPKKTAAGKKAVSAPPASKRTPVKTAPAKQVAKPSARKVSVRTAPMGDGEAGSPQGSISTSRTIGGVTPEQRYRMICDAAYFRAERRGFVGGNALQDWLDAEAEIDGLLREMQQ